MSRKRFGNLESHIVPEAQLETLLTPYLRTSDVSEIEINLAFPEPPHVQFVEQNEKKKSLELVSKVDVKVKHSREGQATINDIVHIDCAFDHTIE